MNSKFVVSYSMENTNSCNDVLGNKSITSECANNAPFVSGYVSFESTKHVYVNSPDLSVTEIWDLNMHQQ